MSGATRRALLALAKLEVRGTVPTSLGALAAIGSIPHLSRLVTDDDAFARNVAPALCLGVLVPLAGAVLGGSAVGNERAEGTWGFLLSRAVSRGHVMAVKHAVRGIAVAVVFLGVLALLRTWPGASPWWEALDLPARLGLRLAIMLTVACFAAAFWAGTKLDDPIVASLGGAMLGVMLVGVLLMPGIVIGGSLREAIELSPRAWRSAQQAREGCLGPDTCIRFDKAAGAAVVVERDTDARTRVVIIAVGKDGAASDVTVLPQGTEVVGWEEPGRLRVRFSAEEGAPERSAGLDGRTQPRSDRALPMTDPSCIDKARCEGDRLVLTIDGRDLTIIPRGRTR